MMSNAIKVWTRTIILLGLIGSVLVVAGPAQAAYPCGQLFESPADDAPNNANGGGGENVDNLDLIGGGIVAVDDASFTVSVGVKNLSTTLPENATSANWYFQWTYEEVNYFGRAGVAVTAPGTVTYSFGTYDETTRRYTAIGPTEGAFNEGENGTVEILIPFEQVGAPPASAELTNTYGVTFVGQGVPGAAQSLSAIDRAPKEEGAFGSPYIVGECSGDGGGGDGGGEVLASPKAGLGFTDATPKRGTTTTAKARLKVCGDHAGTVIELQRKVKGVFKTIAAKKLNSECRARFKVVAEFKQAEFRSFWDQQDDDHRTGKSKPVTVTTHR